VYVSLLLLGSIAEGRGMIDRQNAIRIVREEAAIFAVVVIIAFVTGYVFRAVAG
jgi:hypothetical protein